MKIVILASLTFFLVACGGGGSETPAPADKSFLAYKEWLWEAEGGNPADFTLEKFCSVQKEHC